MKNFFNKYIEIITIIFLLLFWQMIGYLGLLPKFIIPTPLEILNAFLRDYKELIFHSKVTIIEAILGLICGIVIAVVLSIFMDLFKTLNRAIYPVLIISQTIPTVALAPILVLWLGYDMTPKIVLITLTTTFPIVISMLDGFRNVDKDTINLLRVMGANKLQILYHLKLPASLSYFYAGLRVSVSYSFIAAVVSEWLGGFEGLGVYMIRSKKLFQYDTMFAIIILISFISIFSMYLVKVSEKKIITWKYIGENNEKNNL
ncbi:ABC transporter permease [Gemella sp. GH3]|nr:ABC transporter permease [Gemella sp. GH3.1]NYS50652.1 ABC transporter permease [Gemella sp. GH3]